MYTLVLVPFLPFLSYFSVFLTISATFVRYFLYSHWPFIHKIEFGSNWSFIFIFTIDDDDGLQIGRILQSSDSLRQTPQCR